MLLDAPGADDADLSSLRHVQYAASPISAELQQRVLDRLPDCDVAQFYGMTEAAPTVTHLTPEDHRRGGERLGSVGRPVPGVEVDIRDGELWIRGPNVMQGYWRREQETADALVDGWYRSGDLVAEDEDGYVYVIDRAKDMIVSGGENVYSLEIEATLLRHPAVAEAAAFAVPDDRWGEAVHAVVVPREPVTADALLDHCRATSRASRSRATSSSATSRCRSPARARSSRHSSASRSGRAASGGSTSPGDVAVREVELAQQRHQAIGDVQQEVVPDPDVRAAGDQQPDIGGVRHVAVGLQVAIPRP